MNTGTMSLMITPDPVVGPAQILLSCTGQDRFILSLVDASGRERNIHFQGEIEADGSRRLAFHAEEYSLRGQAAWLVLRNRSGDRQSVPLFVP